MRDWARSEFPGVDLQSETAAFRDHEFKDAKTDWSKAWRNWIRRASGFTQTSGGTRPPSERPLTPAERRAYESSPHLCDERVHRLMAAERQTRPHINPANVIDMEPSHDHPCLLD